MDSDTSLTLIDDTSSFQVLDSSTSFVLLEDAPVQDHLDLDSHYDAEDEWLQLETGSVISSMSLILKPDGSILSEYSILDSMHASALNEGCKLIRTRPDIYVEDQTMRKILEYISMFSDEVASCLKLSRSAQSLVSSQKIQEDWEISSLVDLDDISIEALGLLLDILEEFGMYKLCLIVCNRYSLGNRIGRYIVGLASRYSFLSESRYLDLKGGPQVQKAAVAYVAVHNMLEMINPAYISLKEKDGRDLGIEAYQGLLLLGYWKKLVYLMDFDNSLALTNSFGDFKNYKQAYLIRVKNSEYDLSKEDFLWVKEEDDVVNMKLALDSVIHNFHGFMGIGQNRGFISYVAGDFPVFPEKFKYNQMLWKYLMKISDFEEFFAEFSQYLESSSKLFSRNEKDELELHDFFTCFIQILYAAEEPLFTALWTRLTFDQFEKFLQLASILCRELTPRLILGSSNNLFSILAPLGVRKIVESEVTAVYPLLTHGLLHRSSCFVSQLSVFPPGSVVPDLEAHYCLVPIAGLKKNLFSFVVVKLKRLYSVRNSYLMEGFEDELLTRVNLFGEIWMLEFIQNQELHKEYMLDSYNYIKLNAKTIDEYRKLKDRYRELVQMGDTDHYSEIYLRLIKGTEMKKLERRIRQIENLNNNSNKFFNEATLIKLVKLAEVRNSFPEFSKSARLALLTVAQNYIVNAENSSDPIILKNMWMSYHLFKLIKRTDFYLQVLRHVNKKVIRNHIKLVKAISSYQLALGFADIDAYFLRNHYYEAYQTILSIFDSDFSTLDIEHRSTLLSKASLCWLLSTSSSFSASPSILSLFPTHQISNSIIELPASIHKPFSPRTLLSYCFLLLRELNISDTTKALKDSLLRSLYEDFYRIVKYCGANQEVVSMMNNQENMISLEIAANGNKLSQLEDFIGISEKGWESFQMSYEATGFLTFVVKSWADEVTVNKLLELDWLQEQRRIGHEVKMARIIKNKLTRKTVKREVLAETLCYVYGKPASKLILPAVYKFNIELMDLHYKVHMRKVLDYHHLFSKFSAVAELYRKAKTIDEGEAEKALAEVVAEIEDFRGWRKAITPEIENPKPSRKKQYKMRWPMRFKYAKKRR